MNMPDIARYADVLSRSVVKLFTTARRPNHYQPWDFEHQRPSGGSGCIIQGNQIHTHWILTSAHVVADSVFIQASKPGDSRRYTARVLFADHDTETALLTVDDPEFFEGTLPARLGGLPPRNAPVAVYGFPIGGEELCVTVGVVSRIQVSSYTHSERNLLSLQIDAALNPGNSGGPVFMGDELVGLAFQMTDEYGAPRGAPRKQGYVVPTPVIRHMLEDTRDGDITGVPDLGVYWQKIANDSLRTWLGMPASLPNMGVMVTRVVHGSSACGVLRERDVLLSIDGEPIASDGSVTLQPGIRVDLSHAISQHQVGDHVNIDLLRDDAMLTVTVGLKQICHLVPSPKPDTLPSYVMFAGLVLTPLTSDFLSMFGSDPGKGDPRWRYYYRSKLPSERHKQAVILSHVLAHEINVGYQQIYGAFVERINGVDITSIEDVPRALASPQAGFHVIEVDRYGVRGEEMMGLEYGTRIVLDASATQDATEQIMRQNRIPADRSPDLPTLVAFDLETSL